MRLAIHVLLNKQLVNLTSALLTIAGALLIPMGAVAAAAMKPLARTGAGASLAGIGALAAAASLTALLETSRHRLRSQ